MLEKLEILEVDPEDKSALNLRFPPAPRSGSYPVVTQELSKSYGEHNVFSGATITIERGEKVAFVINGQTYYREVKDNGLASLAINLGHGEYDVKISYNGVFGKNQTSAKAKDGRVHSRKEPRDRGFCIFQEDAFQVNRHLRQCVWGCFFFCTRQQLF